MSRTKSHIFRLIPLLVLPMAQIVFFWHILAGRRFFLDDVVQQYYPSLSYVASSLRQFRLPYWSPYVFSGIPFLGDMQTQTFYPPCWLLTLFVNPDGRLSFYAVELLILLHLLLAGYAMYGLMRELELSREGAAFAGLCFMFSGFLVLRTVHLTAVCTIAWLPLIVQLLYRSLNQRRLGVAFAAGLVLGLAALAGHPQFLLYIGFTLGLCSAFYCFRNWRLLGAGVIWRSAISLAIVGAVGTALAAVQYLPSLEMTRHTFRTEMRYSDIVEASLRPVQLLTLFVPKFFGAGGGDTVIPFWAGAMNYYYWETVIYVGILPLVLAGFAIRYSKHPWRWFSIGLALIALLLALGRYTLLYRLALALLPGLDRFRIPGRFSCLFTLGMAMAAGLGANMFIHPSSGSAPHHAGASKTKSRTAFSDWRRILLIAWGLASLIWLLFRAGVFRNAVPEFQNPEVYHYATKQWLVFLGFLGLAIAVLQYRMTAWFRSDVAFLLLSVITFADLYVFGHNFNATPDHPATYAFVRNESVIRLQQESTRSPFRINVRRGPHMLMGRNQGNLDRLELIEGYTPLGLARYIPYVVPEPHMLNLLNVRYRIDSTNTRLVLNPDCLPRAWMVYRFELAENDSDAIRWIRNSAHDYRHVAIVEHHPGFDSRSSDSIGYSVTITRREPDRMELHVQSDSTGLLILSEVYYPEWRATIDGRPAKIIPAYYALRGITIPAGQHLVRLWFDPRRVRTGAIISLISLMLSLGVMVHTARRTRRQQALTSRTE